MTKLISLSILVLVSSARLCADHLPTHGVKRHFDLNPSGGYYNAGSEFSPAFPGGCVSLQAYHLAEGGRPGEACPFLDDLNQPLNPFHVEMHLLNRGATEVVMPLRVTSPFLNITVLEGILTLQAGQTAYFDIHVDDSSMGPGAPGSDVGPWLVAIFPFLFPVPNTGLQTTFPMAYDVSITEDVSRPDVVPPAPVFVLGAAGADPARISLVRLPEPALFGLTGASLLGMLYRRVRQQAFRQRVQSGRSEPV